MSLKFTSDHEWVDSSDQNAVIVGITAHAQEALGDVVFVELPDVGKSYDKGDTAGTVESVKAAADIYMPVSGEVVAINQALVDEPALANSDPQGKGWFFKVKLAKPEELAGLMDDAAYQELLKNA